MSDARGANQQPVSTHRDAIRTARSVVVKIGTTALTTKSGLFDAGRLAALADAIESRMKAGSDVVIVSSGAPTPAGSRCATSCTGTTAAFTGGTPFTLRST